jgi:hypothetical protein
MMHYQMRLKPYFSETPRHRIGAEGAMMRRAAQLAGGVYWAPSGI